MHPGYITRGQGCRVGDRWGVIVRHAAEVDGEEFVIVKFRDGEQLVSVDELSPATLFNDEKSSRGEERPHGLELSSDRQVVSRDDQFESDLSDEEPAAISEAAEESYEEYEQQAVEAEMEEMNEYQ